MQALVCASDGDYYTADYAPTKLPKPNAKVYSGVIPHKTLVESWLEHACRTYATQLRYIWKGKTRAGHEMGWSPTSILGRIREERDGAGQGTFEQHYAECLTEDALIVRRAIDGMDYDPYIVFHVHYLISASSKIKFAEAGYKTSTGWDHLKVAHAYIKGRILLLDTEDCLDRKNSGK